MSNAKSFFHNSQVDTKISTFNKQTLSLRPRCIKIDNVDKIWPVELHVIEITGQFYMIILTFSTLTIM